MKTSTKPEPLSTLQLRLKINFAGKKLFQAAFIHRSYLNEHKDYKGTSNERLEFLGDSVLSLVVSKFLYESFPQKAEGELTQLRAALVRTETLAKIATDLELGKYLLLSRGEEESGGRNNTTILANTFEALIGAIYLDLSTSTADEFIKKHILDHWETLSRFAASDNKSKLQEVVQKKYHQSPVYKLLASWGPDHNKQFEIGTFIGDRKLGRGLGRNKQEAAQAAAEDALTRLKKKSLR